MDTTTLPTVGLPPELYREIAEALYRLSDRPALLSLSLVNKGWRDESQRVLFRDVRDGYWTSDQDMLRKWLDTHLLFLQAVCAHPHRLGRYVHSYRQYRLAWDPDQTPGDAGSFTKPCFQNNKSDGIILWGLTVQALPTLVNLKRLELMPRSWRMRYDITGSLARCNFQLQSFQWACFSVDSIRLECLLTQKSLIHLDISELNPISFPVLPRAACPLLVSIACPVKFVPSFGDRNIVGYKLDFLADLELGLDPVSIAHVKYLSVWRYAPHSEFSSIVLLEIERWDLKTIQHLAYLPELRTLALGSHRLYLDITHDEGARMGVVAEACKRCPVLERILHTINTPNPYEQRYSQFSIARSLADTDCVPTVVYTDVRKDVDFDALWWDVYDVA